MQLDLFPELNKIKPKPVSVSAYRANYVREPTAIMPKIRVHNKSDVIGVIGQLFQDKPVEFFVAIAVDTGMRIMGYQTIEGSTNQCAVYPASIFRFLLSVCASGFFIGHNHPGGARKPSEADITITKRLNKAGKLLDCCLIDHFIYYENNGIYSFKENGLI